MNQDWLLFKQVFNTEHRYVLATIINTEGSTYRKSGAMMLITETTSYGLLSGGCLEEDIRLHGLECLANLQQKVIRYDLRNESDELWGLGLGCEGAIDILLQPLTPENNHLNFAELLEFIEQKNRGLLRLSPYSKTAQPFCIETNSDVLEQLSNTQGDLIKSGKSTLFSPEKDHHRENSRESRTESHTESRKETRKESHVDNLVDDNLVDSHHTGFENASLLIPIRAPINVLICGAGPDVQPFINLCNELGWQLHIWDHRKGYLNQACFHSADKRLVKPHSILASNMNEMDAVVIMSHHLDYDKHYLKAALESKLDYIGLLGPVKRKLKLLEALSSDFGFDGELESKFKGRLFGPVGLDIKANSPASIALSVVAQLQHHFYSKQPFAELFNTQASNSESLESDKRIDDALHIHEVDE